MASNYETFWHNDRFAVVGNAAKTPFPKLTYDALKKRGKTVYAVDPSGGEVAGDQTFCDFGALPGKVDAVVIEVPKEETAAWVQKAVDLGVKDVWIHMKRDTKEALELAKKAGINLRYGTCAVMYNRGGFHTIHKVINKLFGRY
jgi:predicted CoA-binding protein